MYGVGLVCWRYRRDHRNQGQEGQEKAVNLALRPRRRKVDWDILAYCASSTALDLVYCVSYFPVPPLFLCPFLFPPLSSTSTSRTSILTGILRLLDGNSYFHLIFAILAVFGCVFFSRMLPFVSVMTTDSPHLLSSHAHH
ncbi:hypothetical protein C8Q74DRAFT_301151 [Fomes fomentarius]|nr:hypothetical protein C8Q74DRAFT_301151 [Fomes fomentarius]